MKIPEMKRLIRMKENVDVIKVVHAYMSQQSRREQNVQITTDGGSCTILTLHLAKALEASIIYFTAELQKSGVEV